MTADISERQAFKSAFPHLDFSEDHDGWGHIVFKHSPVQALWDGWRTGRLAADRGHDIVDRLMDFERCGIDARDRVNMRECAAIEIHKLRQEIERLKKSAPGRSATQNTAEGLRTVTPQCAGAEPISAWAVWHPEYAWGLDAPQLYPSKAMAEKKMKEGGVWPLHHGWRLIKVAVTPALSSQQGNCK